MNGNTIVGIVAACVFSFLFVLFLLQVFCCNSSSRYNNRSRRQRRTTWTSPGPGYSRYATSTTATPKPPLPTSAPETGDASDATSSNAPAFTQDHDGRVMRLVPPLPLPAVTRHKGTSNDLGHPHKQPSNLLPMYMDGSDG